MRHFRWQFSIRNSAIASLLCVLALAGCDAGLSGAATDIQETALPPATATTDAADGQGTYIQIATLQSKSRADAVIAKLTTAGLEAEIREHQAGGKTLYRIIVGPAKSPEALEIMLGVVKELGYKDAIVLG